MTVHAALAVAALVAAGVLYVSARWRLVTALALAAAALEVAMGAGWLRLGLPGTATSLALGLALAVPGGLQWWRASGKLAVTSSAVLAFVGALQVALTLASRR
jgi:hypothetical protein